MHVLVINSGSSSIKFSLFETGSGDPRPLYEGEISGVGSSSARFSLNDASGKALRGEDAPSAKATSPEEAMHLVSDTVTGQGVAVDAVGYRVVHPGPKLHEHQRITGEVMEDIRQAVSFAPLHDATVIDVIESTQKRFPNARHYACFDTVFHQTMPESATTYAIPKKYRDLGVRRYGFHGLSCESIVLQLQAEEKAGNIRFPHRMAIAHLGSGCSVTAMMDGRSVDTTMGLTPTGGVIMGTRPGDLDPGLVLYLLRQIPGSSLEALESMLNHEAGMVAVSGMQNDMKAVRQAASQGHAQAKLAIDMFTRSVKKAVGGYAALLGGLDALVFAGGIGEHDVESREEIAGGLAGLGIVVDSRLNREKKSAWHSISASDSVTAIYVVPAKEEWVIARHVQRMDRT